MPKYSIQAPDGRTYQIDGPPGATDDQVRQKVLEQHPQAARPAPKSFLGMLGRGMQNLPGDAVDTVKAIPGAIVGAEKLAEGAYQRGIRDNLPTPLQGNQPRYDTSAFDATVRDTVGAAKGFAQHVREMSPADQRGTAPSVATPDDTAAYNEVANANYDKYGTKQNVYRTVAEHPIAAIGDVASVVDPVLKIPAVAAKVGEAGQVVRGLAGAVGAKVGEAAAPLADVVTAERRGTAIAEQGRTATTADEAAAQAAAEAKSAADAAAAQRTMTLAQKRAAYEDRVRTLRAQKTAASAAPELGLGDPAHLDEIGTSYRDPAVANADKLNEGMRTADAQYRDAMQQVVDARATMGVGVSDMPTAKDLIAKSRAIVKPDPVGRPTVGLEPAADAGGRLHQRVLDALTPQKIPLSPSEAAEAAKKGDTIITDSTGAKYKIVKPSFQGVDELRRFLGQVRSGTVEDFKAIPAMEAGNLYGDVSKVLDEYAMGTRAPVQANWKAGKAALAPYEEAATGKMLTGVQPNTGGMPSTPASAIPGRVVAGGREGFNQIAAITGRGNALAALRSQVQNGLAGKSADAAHALVAPGTQLGSVIAGDSELSAQVSDYLQRLRASEQAGTDAQALGKRLDASTARTANLNKVASALQDSSAKAAVTARQAEQNILELKQLPAPLVIPRYRKMLTDAHTAGRISTENLSAGMDLANSAEKAFKTKDMRDTWLKNAGMTLGAGAIPLTAGAPLAVAGAAAGAGLGIGVLGRNLRHATIFRHKK